MLKYLLLLLVFTFSSSVGASGGVEIPRSVVVELKEPLTNRVYPIFIKTPRSYEFKPDKNYPVIYLTDAWYTFQIASGATRFPMNSGKMKEAIIVGISYSKGSEGSASRVRDFTPSKAPAWKMQTGNAEGHARFIREVVFPYIEENYRANGSQRTFVGNSLGGLFGAYVLFRYPDMFQNYILGSPSVWFDENRILRLPLIGSKVPIRVYLSVGSLEKPSDGEGEDMVSGAKLLAKKISSQSGGNIELEFRVIDGARHTTAFPTTLIQGLDWIYGQ